MQANLFSTRLFNMSTENIKELKAVLIKTMQDNLQSIEERTKEAIRSQTDNKHILTFVNDCYKEKQLEVDNLANFIIQFLSSLEDVFQEMNFKDKKIEDIKKSIHEQSDFIVKIQDQVQQYKDKLINAEDYIHWMEEQMQYFDLLSHPNQKKHKQTQLLSKCRSQKTFPSSELQLQNEKSQRRKRIDYERIKFYIENLKQQKNHLIKEYNNLVDQHQRKLFECQKHSILLDELFCKYKNQSVLENLCRTPTKKRANPESHTDFELTRKSYSQKKLTDSSDNQVSVSQDHDDHVNCSFRHFEEESELMKLSIKKKNHSLKLQYDQNFNDNSSTIQSFVSDVFYKHQIKIDVGTNTKKTYQISASCQTDLQDKMESTDCKKIINANKLKISKKLMMQDLFRTQDQDIKCEISIKLQNLSNNQINKLSISRFINRQILGQNDKGYTTCHRQKKKGSKHLCQHIYCFLTNKVVTDRIKTYKYSKK